MEKVFEVIKKEDEYLLQEVDISAMEFEDDEELEDWVSLHKGYRFGFSPYRFVVIYQPEFGSQDISYYFDEGHLRDMWEDEVVDELLESGVFFDDEVRFELYKIGNQP